MPPKEVRDIVDGFSSYSTIAHFEVNGDMAEEEFKAIVKSLFLDMAQAFLSAGAAFIGHIKAYIDTEHGFLAVSLVEPRLGVDFRGGFRGRIRRGTLWLLAVIPCLDEGTLEGVGKRLICEAFARKGMKVYLEEPLNR